MQVAAQGFRLPGGRYADADAVEAAAQVFEDGLARIWVQDGEDAPEATRLIASIATRMSAMALRATVRAARSGTAGGGLANAAAEVTEISARFAAADPATSGRRLGLSGAESAAASRIVRRSRVA